MKTLSNTMARTIAIVLTATLGMAGAADARERADDARADRSLERPANGRADRQNDRKAERQSTRRDDRQADRQANRRTARVDNRVDSRQVRQHARIRDGIGGGELTRREARGLRKDQKRIARMQDRFGADGRYTGKERRRLDRALDRTSRRIARAKHNPRTRDASGVTHRSTRHWRHGASRLGYGINGRPIYRVARW